MKKLASANKDFYIKNASTKSIDKTELCHHLQSVIIAKIQNYTSTDDMLFQEIIAEVIREETQSSKMNIKDKRDLAKTIFNHMRRMGVLQPLLEDTEITEIMVNGPKKIFFERAGRLYQSEVKFRDTEELNLLLVNFFSRANRPLNESLPIADLRLPDGSRANAVLPPIAPDGPIFTIRKFAGIRPNTETLIKQEFISQEALQYLEMAVKNKKTIFLCGGTGSGKTTFLNILSSFIDPNERVITIEDSAELSLQGLSNVVRLEARPSCNSKQSEIDIGQLIRAALRMRPDRLIVGEVRGKEAAEMLKAIHTGHPGSLCTGHANSCYEMMMRLAIMVQEVSRLPFETILRQISMGIDVIVHIVRLADGRRKINEIAEIVSSGDNNILCHKIYELRNEDNLYVLLPCQEGSKMVEN